MNAQGFEARMCRRPHCGHHRHSHSSSDRHCMVQVVSGPASDHPLIVSKEGAVEPDMHPGRTVTRCECVGFLS